MNFEKRYLQQGKSSDEYCVIQHCNNAISLYIITFVHLNSNKVLAFAGLYSLNAFLIIKINCWNVVCASFISEF